MANWCPPLCWTATGRICWRRTSQSVTTGDIFTFKSPPFKWGDKLFIPVFGKLSLNVNPVICWSVLSLLLQITQKKINDPRGGVCFTLLALMVESACCKHERMKPALSLEGCRGRGGRRMCQVVGGWPWADRCPDSPTLTLAPAGSSTPPVPTRVSWPQDSAELVSFRLSHLLAVSLRGKLPVPEGKKSCLRRKRWHFCDWTGVKKKANRPKV